MQRFGTYLSIWGTLSLSPSYSKQSELEGFSKRLFSCVMHGSMFYINPPLN